MKDKNWEKNRIPCDLHNYKNILYLHFALQNKKLMCEYYSYMHFYKNQYTPTCVDKNIFL